MPSSASSRTLDRLPAQQELPLEPRAATPRTDGAAGAPPCHRAPIEGRGPCSGSPREDDEEALAETIPAALRSARGIYFTPRPLVDRVLTRCAPYLPERVPTAVVDPACGAGAFLAAAAERWPRALLAGLELDPASAERCRERVPTARVTVGNALSGEALDTLLAGLPADGFELWVGNPPYNGTSELLREPAAWSAACAWLPPSFELPRGASLREDYVFFLLRASVRLAQRPGALAFVTSATLLDSYLYAPVRRALMERMDLRDVIDLGAGAFRGTRVRTCVTVWTTRSTRLALGVGHSSDERVRFEDASGATSFAPESPDFRFRPDPPLALALDRALQAQGEPLSTLVPVSLPGLKTRFDELLVDGEPERLAARVAAFLDCEPSGLEAFARAHGLPPHTWSKLAALKDAAGRAGARYEPRCIRPFLRYRGARPMGAPAFCYLDRALIPRGDHRLRGAFDPHRHPVKLVFNAHELPLAARVVDVPGCVTAYRHARFAPLEVPRRLVVDGLEVAPRLTDEELATLAWNLSPRGRTLAERLGGPRQAFDAIAAFLMSDAVQRCWAPTFGASREPVVPVETLAADGSFTVEGLRFDQPQASGA